MNLFHHFFTTSVAPPIQELTQPCNPSPCGANTVCKERNGVGSCSCLPEYFGDPYVGCKPECVTNNDCNRDKACIQNKCKDPCPGVCGPNAICKTHNHNPSCYCQEGFTGDPLRICHEIRETTCKIHIYNFCNSTWLKYLFPVREPLNPCQPSPCGLYSQCREVNSHAVCSCIKNYIGVPPNCRPECTISSECNQDKACINQRCVDPCPGTCGLNARCQVLNHNPICSCSPGFTGDPFVQCLGERSETSWHFIERLT